MSLLLAMLLLPRYVCLVLIGSVSATSGHCFLESETSEVGSGLAPVLLQLAQHGLDGGAQRRQVALNHGPDP